MILLSKDQILQLHHAVIERYDCQELFREGSLSFSGKEACLN